MYISGLDMLRFVFDSLTAIGSRYVCFFRQSYYTYLSSERAQLY